jgi:hypothetical protein
MCILIDQNSNAYTGRAGKEWEGTFAKPFTFTNRVEAERRCAKFNRYTALHGVTWEVWRVVVERHQLPARPAGRQMCPLRPSMCRALAWSCRCRRHCAAVTTLAGARRSSGISTARLQKLSQAAGTGSRQHRTSPERRAESLDDSDEERDIQARRDARA